MTQSLIEAAGGAVAHKAEGGVYSQGTVIRALSRHKVPLAGDNRNIGLIVEPGDVAIIQRVVVLRPEPSYALNTVRVSYEFILLRSGEVARDVAAYQIGLRWEVVEADVKPQHTNTY